ncbi:MAG: aldo/keto reductase [Planctomycetota bacterium]|jgi:predicted aldo/keto reductase-like oxidoreductase
MKEKHNRVNRRSFLKTVGAAGLVPALAGTTRIFAMGRKKPRPGEPPAVDPNTLEKAQPPKPLLVPKRKLGKLTELDKSGKKVPLKVPCLSLGTLFNVVDNQAALREALRWGVTYWDTAYSYAGGNSELGIGKFLEKNPKMRKRLFIVSKASDAKTIDDIEKRLQESLKRMKTDYVDLYYGVHILSDPAHLTDELKEWAESAKKRKLIRFFGFSTHDDMAPCLAAAAKLDWIDAIMLKYNFRQMQNKELNAAIEACYKAGIGLTAMKTQARGQKPETEADKKLTDRFIKRGFNAAQAKIKVVLADKRISSVAVGRGDVKHLREDIAAVLDKTKFTPEDLKVFKKVSQETCSGYCAGCTRICSSAVPDMPYVGDIMRYLMYYNSYGEKDEARALFAKIPAEARNRLLSADYTLAEARCPQWMPIGQFMAEAAAKLA